MNLNRYLNACNEICTDEHKLIVQYIENAIREQMCQYIGQKSSKQAEAQIASNLQTILANLDKVYSCDVSDNVEFTCETDDTDRSKINIIFTPKSNLGKLIIRDLQQCKLEELDTARISKFKFILGE
jgi:hypothetical protein